MNEEMKLENQHCFASVKMALDALVRWDEVARDEERIAEWKGSRDDFDAKLLSLLSWESDIYVRSIDDFMDFLAYRQPKQKQTTEE